ncbi:MAG: O-antigen ligase family protein [Acidobacteria bacterium]|nr:O-antigen ligase family protein [Acidobacteriota bacterium]
MRAATTASPQVIVLLLLGGLALGVPYFMSRVEVGVAFWIAAGLVAAVVAFLRTEFAIYLLIVAMLLSPEVAVAQMAGGERSAKGVTLRFDDILLVIVGSAWFIKTALVKELNLLVDTPLNKPVFLYGISCIGSTLLGMAAGRVSPVTGSLFTLKYVEYFIIFWMVINATYDERQIRRYLAMLFGVALVVSVVAVLQVPSGLRVTAPFQGTHGEPNTLGGYLLFILALLGGIIVTAKKHRLFLLGFFGVLLVPFVYTMSRASYVAFIPMLYTLFYVTRRRMLIVALTVALLFAVMVPSVVLPSVVVTRIASTFTRPYIKAPTVFGRKVDISTTSRIQSFFNAVEAFQQKPIFGWGVTGYGFIDSQYLRTLVETGLVGICVFVFLVYRIFQTGWNALHAFRDREPLYYGLSGGFIAGTVGLLVHGIGTNTFILIRVMEPFWLVCALIFLLTRIASLRGPSVAEGY